MRSVPVLLVTAGLVASLTACAGGTDYAGCAHYPSGDATELVDVTGTFGATPSIDFPTPVVTSTTQSAELIAGEGDRLHDGQPARVELSIYNGTTGTEIQSTPYDGNGIVTMVGESSLPAVGHALECAQVGSRIVVTASAEDAHKAAPIAQLNVAADDPFIFVIDVLDGYLAQADGAPQTPEPGMPVVVTAPNGAPGITVPKSGSSTATPPTELQVTALQRGDGDEVTLGSHIVVQYTGVLWETNKVFDSTWADNNAAVFGMTEDSVIPGFLDGLVGQAVGSKVLLVIPPELGYGDSGNGSVPAGSTLVFVVDILGQITSE